MKKLKIFDYVLYSAIIVFGILVDQLTKFLAVSYLKPIPTKPILEGVLHLTYLENRGAAFGMLADHRWVFILLSTVALLALGFFLFGGLAENRFYSVSVALILSGGIGNMIDRLVLGYVVDFIDFRLINFAVFNGADSFVCVGAALLIFCLVKDLVKEVKKQGRQKK